MENSLKTKKVINIIGNILMILSLVYIVKSIFKYKINLNIMFSMNVIIIMVISITIYAIIVLIYAKLYKSLIGIFNDNGKIPKRDLIYIYCKSNLYKYLPGNVFQYVGRNEIAIGDEISHSNLNLATIAEIFLLLLSSFIVSILLSGKHVVMIIVNKNNFTLNVIVIIIIILVIIIIRFCSDIKMWINNNFINKIRKIRIMEFFKFFFSYSSIFIVNGTIFVMVLITIGDRIDYALIAPIIGINAFSWVVGFITPGAPAGLGIREVLMSSLLLGKANSDIVITAVVLYRIITIMGDILGFILIYIYGYITTKKSLNQVNIPLNKK